MKKKILALLLTVVMVALLVPAIVVSTLAADAITEDRAEVAVHSPLLEEDNVEVLNKDGVRVGYFATLTEAVADLRDGDTVNLLDNVTVSAMVELSGNFVLNGNGYAITYVAAVEPPVEPENPENQGSEIPAAALFVGGNGTDIVIQNLTVNVPELPVGVAYSMENDDVAALTLQNCSVSAQEVAVFVSGNGAALTVKGAGSSYYGDLAAVAVDGGFVDIYGGNYSADDVVIAAHEATVAVYDGTFVSAENGSAIVYADNATVILAGGEYATTAGTNAALVESADADIRVLGGKYYQADADAPLFNGGAVVYQGFFYGQSEIDLSAVTLNDGYAVQSYAYEDPTFPANTKLELVEATGYFHMSEIVYDEAWLAENGYNGTAYDVTNGVYNEYPVFYYGFELERAYFYLGNGGSLTVTRDVEFASDSALTFRQRPATSEVTLTSLVKGDGAYTLRALMDGNYPLVATGGTYNISDLRLFNALGGAVLLDADGTDKNGNVLNLLSGASVAGYDGHSVWVNAYSTLNVYDGAYVHAAAGVNGNYDGTGYALITLVGGSLNVYGGNLGYARLTDADGYYVDTLATSTMNTVAVAVDEATDVAASINIYNGKLGKSETNLDYATAIINLSEEHERMDGTKIYVENGEFNSAMNSIIRCSGRNIEILIKGGTFNGPTVIGSNLGHSDLICVNGLSADVHNRLTIEGGSFSGGRDQFIINGYAKVSVSNTYHVGAMSSVFALHGKTETPVTLTNSTVESTVHAFWCNSSAFTVTDCKVTVKGASWGPTAFAVEGDAATAGNIVINGGSYEISNGYFVQITGLAERTVTVNDASFNGIGGSCFCMNPEGRADLVINSGSFVNNYNGSHQIETWGDPAKTVGSVTINGGTFTRGGSASGRMIKFYGSNNVTINGGYFDSKTSEVIVIEKDSNRSYAPTLTLTINGGTFRNDVDGYSLIFMNTNAEADIVITDGTFQSYGGGWGPCLDVAGKGVTNVYGGSYESLCSAGTGSDACVTVGDGICNIYAGTFRANGMCVARGLAGKTGGEGDVNGSITTTANSRLNIYGGVLTLENNPARTAGNYSYDAVIRCGGGSTYAFVSIYGGTFINNSGCSERVISKNNVHSSINLTGGVFMASAAQKFYYKSTGMAATGGSEYPTTPYAKGENDPIVNYGGKEYHQFVLGSGASPFNGKMEDGAQIRITGEDCGIRFVTRYAATSLASLKSLAGDTLDNVTFGTLIVETETLAALPEFSFSGLARAGVEDYFDVVATELNGTEALGYTIAAAVSGIAAEDYETSYSAIGYAKVKISDGNTVYFYTGFDQEKNSRSIAQVAAAALADVRDDQTQGYVYEHITLEGKYSRYTPEQQTAMQAFIPTPDAE